MRIRKEVAREGTYCYRNKAGKMCSVTATPEILKYWGDSGNQMLSAGFSIPTPIEHDDAAKPLTASQKAAAATLNNAGWAGQFEMGHVEENGVKKQALFNNVEVLDEKVKGKISDGTIKWTSPAFDTFTDATGKKWEGVITHLALTSRPAFTQQEPFQATFSLTPETPSAEHPPSGICLSRAGLVSEDQPGTFSPVYPVAFSLWAGAKFALEDMEDKKPPKKKEDSGEEAPKKKGKEEGEEGAEEEGEAEGNPFGGGESKPKFDPMTGQPIKESLVDPDGDIDIWCVLAYLAEMALGVEIGDEEINAENGPEKLLEILKEAVKGKIAGGDSATLPNEGPAPPVKPGKTNPIIEEQQPVYMSLEEANKITDPKTRQIALALIKAEEKAAANEKVTEQLRQKAFKDKLAERNKRVGDVSRFLPETKREPILAQIAGAKFSLNDDGTVTDEAEGIISSIEAVVGGLPALLKGGKFSVEQQPEETRGGIPDGRMEEVEKEFRRNAGVPQRA